MHLILDDGSECIIYKRIFVRHITNGIIQFHIVSIYSIYIELHLLYFQKHWTNLKHLHAPIKAKNSNQLHKFICE